MNSILSCVQRFKIGERIGHLVAIGPAFRTRNVMNGRFSQARITQVFQCDCGMVAAIDIYTASKTNASCPHCSDNRRVSVVTTHGDAGNLNRLYVAWKSMNWRCYCKTNASYCNYGERGIGVCDEWRTSYVAFKEWSLSHGFSPELEIDRKDNNGNYCPDNCQWTTPKRNARNKRNTKFVTAWNETKSLPDWIDDERCTYKHLETVRCRLRHGWTPEAALTTASKKRAKGNATCHS